MNSYIGKVFNYLTILEEPYIVGPTATNKQRRTKVKCLCKCGKIKDYLLSSLKNGNTKSCGCIRLGSRTIDLLHQRFGRLVVVKRLENDYRQKAQWLCLCDCGKTCVLDTRSLKDGIIKSCFRECELYEEYKKYVGKKINKLTILSVFKNMAKFRCECGQFGEILLKRIISNNTTSCGNCNNNYVGDIFGNLTIIEHIRTNNSGGLFKSICACGNIRIDECHRILTGHISSCGNCSLLANGKKTSKAQKEIFSMFSNAVENYKTDIGFYIDVAIPEDRVGIEYDEWYWHKNKIQNDIARIKKLIDNGWRILHIKASNNIPSRKLVYDGIENLKYINYYAVTLDGWGKI